MPSVATSSRRILDLGTHARLCRYLEDLNTVLVPELMPTLAVKLDDNAVPGKGRRADEVGEFYLMHRSALTSNWTVCSNPSRCSGWAGMMWAHVLEPVALRQMNQPRVHDSHFARGVTPVSCACTGRTGQLSPPSGTSTPCQS